jgi:chromosome segregation ATPase
MGVLVSALLAFPAPAQDAPAAPSEDAVARELARLNRSLEEIVVLLKKSAEHQELQLLIQRLELGGRRLTSLEDELARTRTSLDGLEEERLTLEAMREQFESVHDPTRDDAEELEHQMQELDFRLKLIKDQSWSREQRKLDLEAKISTLVEDQQALEGVLDERLGLR